MRRSGTTRLGLARALMALASLLVLDFGAFAPSARAQSTCASRSADVMRVALTHWPAPLDRRVALHAREISLRDALDRLAANAHVRLSYSSDLLPLDRAVCATFDSVALGDALAQLVQSADVEPVATGGDQVVLTPARRPATPAEVPTSPHIGVLDRVVVTGSATGASERPLSVALDVVTGPQLTRRDADNLSKALDTAVPGMWMWEQAPTSLVARYGSIRGASSFGMSYPKMYIDGIEVANPLLMTQITPEVIDHVEVIRGPQGAALYGADAISGVVNIVTRHDGADMVGTHGALRSDAGLSQTAFAAHGAMVQDHVLTLSGGSNLRSAGVSLGVGTVGEFVPGAFSHDVKGTAGLRLVGSRLSLTGTARFYAKEAAAAANPLVGSAPIIAADTMHSRWLGGRERAQAMDSAAAQFVADSAPQSIRQYTVGSTLRFAQSDRWTHSFVAGVDGYRLSNVPNDDTPVPSTVDSVLRAAGGGADRATLRASSVARFGDVERTAATLTFALEHSAIREIIPVDADDVRPSSGMQRQPAASQNILWRSNTGLVAQTDASFFDALFLTGGTRLERNDALIGGAQFTLLPMLGAAVVHDYGPVTAKLRTAYGRGMRPPATSIREIAWAGMRRAANAPALAPEEQAGIEAGGDLFVGRAFALHVTRFDQRAFGLIQPVGIADSAAPTTGGPRRMQYQLENVGEIGNRGWELQSTASAGRLSLSGSLSLVDSRVRKLASGYSGDLQPGDRMLAVPARTMSGELSWTTSKWFATLNLSRASDWTNYDRLAIANVWSSGADPRLLTGAQLRSFWREYPGVTRFGVSFSRDLTHGFSLLLTGDNLFNQQRGEPDNLTIVPGRTITAGLRAAF